MCQKIEELWNIIKQLENRVQDQDSQIGMLKHELQKSESLNNQMIIEKNQLAQELAYIKSQSDYFTFRNQNDQNIKRENNIEQALNPLKSQLQWSINKLQEIEKKVDLQSSLASVRKENQSNHTNLQIPIQLSPKINGFGSQLANRDVFNPLQLDDEKKQLKQNLVQTHNHSKEVKEGSKISQRDYFSHNSKIKQKSKKSLNSPKPFNLLLQSLQNGKDIQNIISSSNAKKKLGRNFQSYQSGRRTQSEQVVFRPNDRVSESRIMHNFFKFY